jgi:hypothetical protein
LAGKGIAISKSKAMPPKSTMRPEKTRIEMRAQFLSRIIPMPEKTPNTAITKKINIETVVIDLTTEGMTGAVAGAE